MGGRSARDDAASGGARPRRSAGGAAPSGRTRARAASGGARPSAGAAPAAHGHGSPHDDLIERYDALLEVTGRLTGTLDRGSILRTIVDEAARVLRADMASIRIVADGSLEVAAWNGMAAADAERLPRFALDEGWYGEVLRTGRPWVCPDVHADPWAAAVYAHYLGVVEFAGELVIPLVHGEETIGALSASTRRPRDWSPADIQVATALATHAAIAIRNADLFAQTERRAAQLAVVQAASARMSRANGVEGVGRAIVEETRRVLDYHNARVYVIEPPDDVLPIAFEGTVGTYDDVHLDVLRVKLGEGFTGWVAEHGQPLLIDDANLDPRGSTIPGTDDVDESMLVVPMRYDDRTVGVITLSKLGLRQFSPDDLRLLSILADHAATALESARLLDRSNALSGELRRLLAMSSALAESLVPRQVADLIAAHMAEALGVDDCAISYWDRPSTSLLTLGYFPPARIEQLEPSYDISLYPETRRALELQEMVFIDTADPNADPGEVALIEKEGMRALVMVPLVAKGQSIGLVELLSRQPTSWASGRRALARTMANEGAMALENARLYEEARALADRDPLTGFYNHRYLHERLGQEVIRAQRARQPVSVLMLDLDDFKLINDTFGHVFGDRVLVWTAERIRSTLRASDVAARYAGDEFAIILPETDATAARQAADRVLAAFSTAYVDAERSVPVGLSIGVATHAVDGRTATELIAAADGALYRVKAGGGQHALSATEIPVTAVEPIRGSKPRTVDAA